MQYAFIFVLKYMFGHFLIDVFLVDNNTLIF